MISTQTTTTETGASLTLYGLRCALTQLPCVVPDLETGLSPRMAWSNYSEAWRYCRWAWGPQWEGFVTIEPLGEAGVQQWRAIQAARAAYAASYSGAAPGVCGQKPQDNTENPIDENLIDENPMSGAQMLGAAFITLAFAAGMSLMYLLMQAGGN